MTPRPHSHCFFAVSEHLEAPFSRFAVVDLAFSQGLTRLWSSSIKDNSSTDSALTGDFVSLVDYGHSLRMR